jgi:hypothetical protein
MTPREVFESIWAEQAASISYVQTVNYGVDTNALPDIWGCAVYQPEQREDVTMGSTPWVEEQGQFLIGLFTRSGSGPAALDDAVATIRQAFHGAARDGLVVFAVDGPHDLDPEADGEWWRLVLTARYTFQTVRRQDGALYHGWDGFEEQ